jgi:hypothetical protein
MAGDSAMREDDPNMTRKRKQRIVVALAALAIGVGITGLIVASAGAHVPATFEFPNGAAEVKSAGSGEQFIEIPEEGTAVCATVSYKGPPEGSPATAVTVEPTFNKCKFLGKTYFLIKEACNFAFNANGQLSFTSATGENCNTKRMMLTSGDPKECTVWFPEQVLSGVTYTNEVVSGTLTRTVASAFVEGVSGEISKACDHPGPFTEGRYIGEVALVGADSKGVQKTMKWLATVP